MRPLYKLPGDDLHSDSGKISPRCITYIYCSPEKIMHKTAFFPWDKKKKKEKEEDQLKPKASFISPFYALVILH